MNGDACISLYFHIPFCAKKCHYCHFYVIPEQEILKDLLLKAFILEWERLLPTFLDKKIVSIYFGGGTPSLFGPQRLKTLLELIASSATMAPVTEISLEANPDDLTLEKMEQYASVGVNRVSIGIQTLDDSLLNRLGRLHSSEKAMEAVWLTKKAGILNISIDLMYDIPGQTLASWQKTLTSIQLLPITHLSLYNLTIEPHTQFFKNQTILKPLLPDEETSLEMYQMAIEKLEKKGFEHYEISAFSKDANYSLHNCGYWTGRSFLGFGPSAFSYWKGKRFRNIAHLNRYAERLQNGQSPVDFVEELSPQDKLKELLTIQLRLLKGVSISTFEERWGKLPPDTHDTLHDLVKEQFLHRQEEHVALTTRGILFYDHVASELI